ncbi:o-succinylbenzoate--CoA ligase [Staphylococcus borealis]|uniref:o-succinylbenzoate--CoA ligase n=1 Tax=Staphylococcus borealis TaxID=2742203 RepID=UPI000FF72EBE|nr:o-succinylbenzoate--CoA ligase [Staphylococcus borealis]MDM7863382.1 o-succinylbenzoate--CoA ligase [Staphylococcus borealis]MDM7883421.1 o-succinylbenzoate--CoA ligase [Staphylococcus borealis]RIO88663.1 o-succinylbenzoate--CoA ligase [Staphylococcus haemolyticus]
MDFWLKEQSIKNRNKIAVTDGKHSITFKELYDKALSISEHILSLNLNRVGLYIKNDIESIALINACWLANVEIAMLNTRLTETEMINQMNSINITTILTTQPFHLSHFNVIHLSELEQYPSHTNDETFNDERIASIMFTSGTTGPQKAVPQTFKNHYASAIGCKKSLGYDETTKWLSVLPIYHISGLSVLLRSIIEGFTVRILEKYDTQTMLTIIKEEGPTHVSLVPQTLKWLMDAGLNQPFSIEKILLGGAKLSSTLIDEALNYHLPIYNSFGMTETCSQFLTATPKMLAQRYDTVGKPSENVQIRIKHPNREGHGELLIKGNNVMNGYLYPSGLNDTFEDGYFKTGDIAEIDEEGFVMVYDRRKDLIISGGENIYPYEIETIAKTHSDINDAVCVAQEDVTWGQVPVLYYVADCPISDTALINYFKSRLAKYKIPKVFHQVERLPYTSTGKLQRSKMINRGH